MTGRRGRGRLSAVPPASGAAPIEGLLEDMRELRLTLASDLTAAAGAVEAGATDVAADILDADEREVARFARVADERLLRLARRGQERPQPRRVEPRRAWARRIAVAVPVVPVVGAVALSAAAASVVIATSGGSGAPTTAPHVAAAPVTPRSTPLDVSFQHFVRLIDGHPSASEVIAAASRLHEQLQQLIATSHSDPQRAVEIAQLLQLEQTLLIREQPPGAKVVLDATRQLARTLVTATPETTPDLAPSALPSPDSSQRSHHDDQTDAKPATSPQPSSSPTPSGSSSNPGSSSPQPASSSSPAASYPPVPAVPH